MSPAGKPHRPDTVGYVRTIAELGALIGASTSQVEDLIKAGMPRAADKSFQLPAVVPWLRDLERRRERERRPGAQAERLREVEAEYRTIKTELARLQLSLARGELINKTEVIGLLVARATEFSRALMHAARRLAPTLVNNPGVGNIQNALEADFRRVLEAYGRTGDHPLLQNISVDRVRQLRDAITHTPADGPTLLRMELQELVDAVSDRLVDKTAPEIRTELQTELARVLDLYAPASPQETLA